MQLCVWDHNNRSIGRSAKRGFTMVEIALSIAVVAFALVAILGVLPTGMTVQKDNRDDSVINQEGRYWMEAIRNAARGIEDITNYVEAVTITNRLKPNSPVVFDFAANGLGNIKPLDVIALLSTPKYPDLASTNNANDVRARVKAITGPAAEKGSLTNEFSFRYEMQVEITPAIPLPPEYVGSVSAATGDDSLGRYNEAMAANLHELRLTLRWPLVQRGNGWYVGNNRKTFRARVAGSYRVETNATTSVRNTVKTSLNQDLVMLNPNNFAFAFH
jgi:type II secretory pathway pseudopilin PulG